MLADGVEPPGCGTPFKVGRCYKGFGNYERALKYLEEAARVRRDDAEALSELADAYALVNEPRAAKAMFREAYFANPRRSTSACWIRR
jgi:tetratricopeptide (TPR) repeat protein